jgi:hypothetical protein
MRIPVREALLMLLRKSWMRYCTFKGLGYACLHQHHPILEEYSLFVTGVMDNGVAMWSLFHPNWDPPVRRK